MNRGRLPGQVVKTLEGQHPLAQLDTTAHGALGDHPESFDLVSDLRLLIDWEKHGPQRRYWESKYPGRGGFTPESKAELERRTVAFVKDAVLHPRRFGHVAAVAEFLASGALADPLRFFVLNFAGFKVGPTFWAMRPPRRVPFTFAQLAQAIEGADIDADERSIRRACRELEILLKPGKSGRHPHRRRRLSK